MQQAVIGREPDPVVFVPEEAGGRSYCLAALAVKSMDFR
jgi:hypothetical protein